jgi:hypothetical protein
LDHDHEIDEFITLVLEDIPTHCMGDKSQAFNQLSSQLSVFFTLMTLQHLKQELVHFLIVFGEFSSSSFRASSNSSNTVFLNNRDILGIVDQKGTQFGKKGLDIVLEFF